MTSDGFGHSRLNEVAASSVLLDVEDAMDFCVGGGGSGGSGSGRFLDAWSGGGMLRMLF